MAPGPLKSSCHSPNSIEQTVHCDHKPRTAWVHVRLLLHRWSAAGWSMINPVGIELLRELLKEGQPCGRLSS